MPSVMEKTGADVLRDLRILASFIRIYCKHQHADAVKAPADLKTHDVEEICGEKLWLCPDCQKLLAHAFYKRSHCPMDPKPQCKDCPSHCYNPLYRQQIREVMMFSGRKLLLSGRFDYLLHLFF
jgi:hypothetical protein